MIGLPPGTKILFYTAPTDMRKSPLRIVRAGPKRTRW